MLGRFSMFNDRLHGRREPVTYMVKSHVMKALLASPVRAARLEAAKTLPERFVVIKALREEQEFTTKSVDLDEKKKT